MSHHFSLWVRSVQFGLLVVITIIWSFDVQVSPLLLPLPLRKTFIVLNLYFSMEMLLSYLGARAKCIVTSYRLMMNSGMLLKMDLSLRLRKKDWWQTGKSWLTSKRRFIKSHTEWDGLWWKLYLMLNTWILGIGLLQNPSLNYCALPTKKISRWRKLRQTNWFTSRSLSRWKMIKIWNHVFKVSNSCVWTSSSKEKLCCTRPCKQDS